MTEAVFVTDLHGRRPRYEALFEHLADNPPGLLLVGGDLLEPFSSESGFIDDFLREQF